MSFEDFCSINNVCLSFENIPFRAKGFCYKLDEVYYVVINSRYNFESQRKSIQHELIHIFDEHFEKERNNYIEYESNTRVQLSQKIYEYIHSLGINIELSEI